MSVESFYAALEVDLPGTAPEATVPCFANGEQHKHDDRNASCSVNRATGLWCCHGCGEKGNPYGAATARGRTPAEAMALLEDHGLKEPDDGSAARSVSKGEKTPPSRKRFTTTEADVERYREALNPATVARLGELRGWTAEAIQRLELGLDERGRVTFPVRDRTDKLVGLPRYQPNPERRDGPKVKADAGSRRELFPAPEAVDGEPVYLVEGEPDAVAGASLGVPAVAVPGANKWESSWPERFAGRRVVVCMDSDKEGRKAARRAAEALSGHAAEVKVIDLDPQRDDGSDIGDWALAASRNGGLESGRRALELVVKHAEPIRAPEALDVAELLDELVVFVRRFVAMTAAQARVFALWILHTYTLEAAEQTPYLDISSAEKRSGKSRLLDVAELLANNPLSTANVSDAALFRSIGDAPPSLLFDEIDAIFGPKARDREDLRSLMNAGYRRGAVVLRCVGDGSKQKVERFPVFCPKALAGIGELPDTVADRSLPIRLERRAPGEHVERFRRRDAEHQAAPLRKQAQRFTAQSVKALTGARPDLPSELDDRAQDAAEPLLAIADLAGGKWPERARQAVTELRGGASAEDDSIGVRLLAEVRDVFGKSERMSSADLLEALAAIPEAPWGDWYGKPLSARGLAKLLKPYSIKSRTVRLEDGTTPKGFQREQFDGAWNRYLPPVAGSIRHSATTRTTSGIEANPYPPQEPDVADVKPPANPHGKRDVADVADTERDKGIAA